MARRRTHPDQLELPLRVRRRKKWHWRYWEPVLQELQAASVEDAVRRLYEDEGLSMRQIAARVGFGYGRINEILHTIGARIRRRGGKNNPYGKAGKPGREIWH